MPMPPRSRVAVIGAGAAGLAAARELRSEGHAPVVFERAAAVGGTWRYEDAADTADPLGAGGAHSSLYASLRTNLSRESMGFLDFPFVADCSSADPRRFPGHQEVLRYLEAFARRFDLLALVRFETEVVSVRRMVDGPGAAGWRVSYCSRRLAGASGELEEEVFDAVVVCNGHFTEPRVAAIAGKVDACEAATGEGGRARSRRRPLPLASPAAPVFSLSTKWVHVGWPPANEAACDPPARRRPHPSPLRLHRSPP